MFKPILSTFALGLMLFSLLSFSSEEDSSISKEPKKGQNFSLIPWSRLNLEDWTSIDVWMIETTLKESIPEWKIRFRNNLYQELVGKILQCSGSCSLYRGAKKVSVQHLSRILEGDELSTDKDSVAWVFMMDGSLLRLSSESSVSFNEINLSREETFHLVRLNQGHVHWSSRPTPGLINTDYLPETDSIGLPIMIREANQQYFERKIYQNQSDAQRLGEVLNLEDKAVDAQYEYLNELRAKHDLSLKYNSRIMMVSPNMTLIGNNVSFDFVYLFSGNSYFKNRSTSPKNLHLSLRGYADQEGHEIQDNFWYEVDVKGRKFHALKDAPPALHILELLTKRIKTWELAREIWIRDFTLPIQVSQENPEKLAQEFGYTLWGEELKRRYKFLDEYTRRIETTHLRSIDYLLTSERGETEKLGQELSHNLYQASLNDYLLGLKSRYDRKALRVKEMSDLQYYVWILKNGKF